MGQAQELAEFGLAQDRVFGFVERYDPWTGQAWLQVLGPDRRWIPIGSGYRDYRAALRREFPDRPFDAEWSGGQFPSAPPGGPVGPVLVVAWTTAAVACVAAAVGGGWAGAVAIGTIVAVPLVRLLDTVFVSRDGMRLGAPWAPLIPWHAVVAVGLEARGPHRTELWMDTTHGGYVATVPAVLAPAVVARVRRLSGLVMRDNRGLDQRYSRWRTVALAIPWGALVGTLVAVWFTPWPWQLLSAGLIVVGGLTLLGAAVASRAAGWGSGGVVWLSLLYGLILGLWSLWGALV